MKIEIIPAILPRDFVELEDKITLVSGVAKTVQVDVCDGQFTPEPSWPYKKKDDSFEKIISEESSLPGWQKLNFEIDLMVNKPEEVIENWISAGASRVIFHVEAKGDLSSAIQLANERVEIGLAIDIDTPVKILEPHIGKFGFIQCMGIDQIGFQGQEFDYKVLEKIVELKKIYPNIAISVDGGVSRETAPELIRAGASRLVVGSAIFDSDNPGGVLRDLLDIQ